MSSLRKRLFGSGHGSSERTPSPVLHEPHRDSADRHGDATVSVSRKKLERLNSYVLEAKPKGIKRRNLWIFGLGGLVGLIAAAMFASNQEVIDFSHLTDMNLEGFLDVLPAGLVKDARALQVHRIVPLSSRSTEMLTCFCSNRNTSVMPWHMTPSWWGPRPRIRASLLITRSS